MIDAHVHLEKGPYTREWLDKFVQQAVRRGITELWLLEHTSRFIEFREIYKSITCHPEAGAYQRQWFEENFVNHLAEYKAFIDQMRQEKFPIDIKFGLEVCYFPEEEDRLHRILADYEWDFLTGSIHWIDGFGFDHKENIAVWERLVVDDLYRRYYQLMCQAIESGLFDVIAHPDSIKCFNFYPSADMDMLPIYEDLAACFLRNAVKTEYSNGLFINYGHHERGPNPQLLAVLLEHNIPLVTVSDAHKPENVGKFIRQAEIFLRSRRPKREDP